jgi:phosphoglycolate phosphatase-like HAD superfamily hydrolase
MTNSTTSRPLGTPDAILFDIDGTLILGGNSHFPSLEYALQKVLGIPLNWGSEGEKLFLSGREISGWIDNQLFTAAALEQGIILTEELMLKISETAAAHLAERYNDGVRHGIPAPGAISLLTKLQELKIPTTVSTGNIQATAILKLQKSGLDHLFNLNNEGGYGNQINRIAVAKHAAATLGMSSANNIWLVGDNIADIVAATENGFTGIGVSYGAASPHSLQFNGAALVVDSLEEIAVLL